MIDTTQLTQLISALRVETEKESISPETVGSLLQNITDLLANASSITELQIFENWKAILSQLNLVEDIGIGVESMESMESVESVNIALLRLGITDNKEIASILRASIATIYTYRSRLKARAKSKDTFEDDIKHIQALA